MSKQQDTTPVLPTGVNADRMLGYLQVVLELYGEITLDNWNAAVAAAEGK